MTSRRSSEMPDECGSVNFRGKECFKKEDVAGCAKCGCKVQQPADRAIIVGRGLGKVSVGAGGGHMGETCSLGRCKWSLLQKPGTWPWRHLSTSRAGQHLFCWRVEFFLSLRPSVAVGIAQGRICLSFPIKKMGYECGWHWFRVIIMI